MTKASVYSNFKSVLRVIAYSRRQGRRSVFKIWWGNQDWGWAKTLYIYLLTSSMLH